MGNKDKKNILAAADLGGKWRIRGKTGAAYVGEVSATFDNAIVLDQVDGEKIIIFLDSIESMYEGIIGPKAQEIADAVEKEP